MSSSMMRKHLVLGWSLSFMMVLSACSTASVRVMPGENGVNRVVARDRNKEGAEEAAVDAAKDYCEDHGDKQAVFTQDQTQYTGKMDEETRNTVKKASTAAMVLGGGRSAGGVGSVLGSAGTAGHIMTNDRDYQSDVSFKCQ